MASDPGTASSTRRAGGAHGLNETSSKTAHRRRCVLGAAVASVIGLGVLGSNPAEAALTTPAGLTQGAKFRYIYQTGTPVTAGTTTFTAYDTAATADATTKGNLT